jgi:MtrB/PioB family decaheme-associated outer membrane protein
MRTRTWLLIAALVPASVGLAHAQTQGQAASGQPTHVTQPPGAAPTMPATQGGQVTFGLRGTDLDGDFARYNRFRDRRSGALLDGFRFTREDPSWLFRAEADNVGYRDQRFFGQFEQVGRLNVTFEWDQIPFFTSRDTRTIYNGIGSTNLWVEDTVQQALQNANATVTSPLFTSVLNAGAAPFELRYRRDLANVNLTYNAPRDVDVNVSLRNARRDGTNMFAFGLGATAGNMVAYEMPVPVDDRTTDFISSVDWANDRGMIAAGVTASWYNNGTQLVRFDNPLRATDINMGPSAGQAVLWPSNSYVAFNASGAYRLPARSRITGAFSFGRMDQNETLAPPTINTALVAPPLPRTTADAAADVFSMVLGFTSRPARSVTFNARYRLYDFDNNTAHIETPNVVGDFQVGTTLRENEPFSLTRGNLNLEATFRPEAIRFLSFSGGYSRIDNSYDHRIFESTAENGFRFSVDSLTSQFLTMRAVYEWARRDGDGFDVRVLEHVGEQPLMRHYDVANRDRNRVSAQFQVTPMPMVGFNATVGRGEDDYKDSFFGLRDNTHNFYSVGVDVVPLETVNFTVNYGRERFEAFQWSRQANPGVQFNDPTRDWGIDSDDKVNTFTLGLDLLRALPNTDIRFGYDLTDGNATYVYELRPGQTIYPPTATQLQQLPELTSRLHVGRIDVQYLLRRNLSLGVGYWYEDYNVFDFAMNPAAIPQLNLPAAMYLGYLYRPYTANTGWLRLTYLW